MRKHRDTGKVTGGISKRNRPQRGNNSAINDLLRLCLEKVCELQQDLQREDEFGEDPQAAGYAACAIEALNFLSREGLPSDHPVVKILKEKLMQNP